MSKNRLSKQYVLALAALTALGGGAVNAASGTWSGAGADSNWSTTANWTTAVPGATTGTTNTDTATFNSNPANGTTTPIVVDPSRNVGSITFTTAAGSFVIGGNSLLLSNGGTTQIASAITTTGVTETLNAPLVLEPLDATHAGAYTFSNNAADSSDVFLLAGGISGGNTNNTETLNLGGNNTGNNVITGDITKGSATTFAVTKSGNGTWTLNDTVNINGALTFTAGTLNLAGAITGATPLTGSGTAFAAATANITGTNTSSGAVSFTGAAVNITGNLNQNSLGTGAVSLISSTFSATGAATGTYILGTGNFSMNSFMTLTGSSGNNVTFTSASATAATAFTVGVVSTNNDTLHLNGNGGTVSYTIGNASATNALARGATATLILAPTALNNLGASEKFIVNNLAPTAAGSIYSPWLVVSDTAANNNAGDFVTYTGSANGFQAASLAGVEVNESATDINDASVTSTTVFNIDQSNTALTANKQVFALRTNSSVNLGGNTLTIGTGGANTQSGLILNGSGITIGNAAHDGTLSFGTAGAAEALIYTSQSSTINSDITALSGLDLFGPGSVTINGNIALGASTTSISTTGNVVINGQLTGSGTFQYRGSGNLTLTGDSPSLSGTVLVGSNYKSEVESPGTLTISKNDALGTAIVELFNGSSTAYYSTFAITGDLVLSNTFQVGVNVGTNASNIAVITGPGNLTITGSFTELGDYSSTLVNNLSAGKTLTLAGSVALGGQNSYSFGGSANTVINQQVTGTASIGNTGSADLTLNGGFNNTPGLMVGPASVNNTITLGATGTTVITLNSGSSLTGALTTLQANTPLTITDPVTIGGKLVAAIGGLNSMNFNGAITAANATSIDILNSMDSIDGNNPTLTFSGNTVTHATGSTTTTILTFAGSGNTFFNDAITRLSTLADNYSVIMSGTGILTLGGANNYSSTTSITSGTLSVATINSVAGGLASSNLGAPTTVANGTISIGSTITGGTIVDTGTGETTDRVINLAGTTGGATIDQSGTGLLKFTSALTATGKGAKTLTLQGSTAGTGEFAGAIVNSSSGATALLKTGTGTWTLSGTNGYTGGTTITGGTLIAGSAKALGTGNVTVNGGTLALDPVVNIGAGNFALTSGTLNLGLGTDATNALTGTGTYTLGDGTTVDLGIGAATFTYTGTYDILNFHTGTVGNITITDYDTAHYVASINDNGTGTAILSFTAAAPVPEPASLALLGLGAAGLLLRRRRATV